MDDFSFLFLIGMFTPGLIRGAFWHDSPAIEGFFWIFATIALVLVVGWVAQQLLGNGLGPTLAMLLAIIAANVYAIKGAIFASSRNSSGDDIDGDANE
jgi:hypothetical protein